MIDIENWWDGYFDEIYYELYREFDLKPEKLEAEINFIEKSLELKPEDRILDLACGY
jgi:cyclopropane fatty-acyl-phospholipid synthase-like methyltransferase